MADFAGDDDVARRRSRHFQRHSPGRAAADGPAGPAGGHRPGAAGLGDVGPRRTPGVARLSGAAAPPRVSVWGEMDEKEGAPHRGTPFWAGQSMGANGGCSFVPLNPARRGRSAKAHAGTEAGPPVLRGEIEGPLPTGRRESCPLPKNQRQQGAANWRQTVETWLSKSALPGVGPPPFFNRPRRPVRRVGTVPTIAAALRRAAARRRASPPEQASPSRCGRPRGPFRPPCRRAGPRHPAGVPPDGGAFGAALPGGTCPAHVGGAGQSTRRPQCRQNWCSVPICWPQ